MHRDHSVTDYKSVLGEGAQLIDVREPNEVSKATLPEAINIPLRELADRITEIDAERRVVLLCRSGARSTKAAEILTAAGFSDVVNLDGGMQAWAKTQKKDSPRRGFRSLFK